mgnify:CR=1 FL=1
MDVDLLFCLAHLHAILTGSGECLDGAPERVTVPFALNRITVAVFALDEGALVILIGNNHLILFLLWLRRRVFWLLSPWIGLGRVVYWWSQILN